MSSSAVRPGPAPAPEDRGQYVEFEQFIDRRIQQTRGQVKFVDLASGVLVWLSASVLFLLAAALVDAWIWPLPGWGRFTFWLAAIGGSLWFLGTRVAPLLLRRINPLYAAAAIERGKPTLKNSVVNFLLLRDAAAPVPTAVFEAVERQAAAGLAHAPPEQSVDRGSVVRLGYVLLAIVLLAAFYTVASPKDPLRTVARVFLPWADIPPPARVTLLSVVPGDVEAFHGQQVDVKVEAEGNADAATLFYTTADGTRVDQPIPLHRAEGAFHFSGNLPETDAGLQQDLLYHVQVGDALSPKYRVKVLATPTITVDSIEYHYPAYTGLATHRVEKQGDIEALDGTKVVIRATTNGDIKSAHMDLKSDGKFDQPLKFEGRSAELALPLVIPPEHGPRPYLSNYELRFTNTAGHSTRQPIRYSLAVTPDLPPEARLLQPLGAEVDVPENAAIVLETSAIDPDFALRSVVLTGTKSDQPLFEQKLLDEVRTGQFGHKFTFAPTRYKLAAGDDVVVQVRAEDNRLPKPGTGRSTELLIHVVAPDPRAERQPREAGDAGEESPPDEGKAADEPRQPNRQRQGERSSEQDNDQGEGQQNDQKTRQQPSKQRDPQEQGQQEKTDDGQQQDQQSGEGGQGGGEGGQSGGKQSGGGGQQGQGNDGQSGNDQQQAEGGEQGQGGQQGAKGDQSSKSSGGESGDSQGEENGQGGEANQGGQSGKGRQGKQSGGAGSKQGGESGKDSANEPVTNDGDAYEKILDHLKQKEGEQGDQQQGKQADGQKQSQRGERGQGKQAAEQAGDQGQQAEGEGNADQQGKGAPGAGEKQQPMSRPGSRQQQGVKNQGGEAGADEGQDQSEGQAGGESGKAAGEKQAGSKNSRSQPQPDESGKQGAGQGEAGHEQGQQRSQERTANEGAKGAGNEAGKDAAGEDAQGGEGQTPSDQQGGQTPQPAGGKQGEAGKQGQAGRQSGGGEQGAGKSQPGDAGQPQPNAQQGKGNNSPDTTGQQNGGAPKDQGQQKQRGQANERPQNQQDSDAGGQQGDDSAEPATGENGQPGAGRPDQGKGGTPQPQGQNEPKPKQQREGAKQKPKEGDSPRGASDSNKQSDTQGDGDTGQQSGGGNTGGGQSADNQGKGSAGENTPDNEGGGRSQEQGPGETGEGPGQQDEATAPTGEASKDGKRGNGSKSAPGNRGQQPGQSPPNNQQSEQQPGQGKTQPGQGRPGQPNTGTQGELNTQRPAPRPAGPRDAGREPGGDDANLEYADKATDLVLERLRNDLNKGKPDAELLRKLGWSKEDLAKFVRRWEEMKRSARTADTPAPQARRELDAALRSLGLRPAGAKVGSSAAGDTERGLRESRNSRPPAEFEDAFRAYSRGVSGGKD